MEGFRLQIYSPCEWLSVFWYVDKFRTILCVDAVVVITPATQRSSSISISISSSTTTTTITTTTTTTTNHSDGGQVLRLSNQRARILQNIKKSGLPLFLMIPLQTRPETAGELYEFIRLAYLEALGGLFRAYDAPQHLQNIFLLPRHASPAATSACFQD